MRAHEVVERRPELVHQRRHHRFGDHLVEEQPPYDPAVLRREHERHLQLLAFHVLGFEEGARWNRSQQLGGDVIGQKVLDDHMRKRIAFEPCPGHRGCRMCGDPLSIPQHRSHCRQPLGLTGILGVRRHAASDLSLQLRDAGQSLFLATQGFFEPFELARECPELARHRLLVFANLLRETPHTRYRVDRADDSKRIQTLEDGHLFNSGTATRAHRRI